MPLLWDWIPSSSGHKIARSLNPILPSLLAFLEVRIVAIRHASDPDNSAKLDWRCCDVSTATRDFACNLPRISDWCPCQSLGCPNLQGMQRNSWSNWNWSSAQKNSIQTSTSISKTNQTKKLCCMHCIAEQPQIRINPFSCEHSNTDWLPWRNACWTNKPSHSQPF